MSSSPPEQSDTPASSTTGDSKIFKESSFFKEQRAPALPSPAEIRAINWATGNPKGRHISRPLPVTIPSLGLFVKYGASTTIAEAQTQVMIYEKLHDQVPTAEVFGWTEDEGQVFIYMSLVAGETLEKRWHSLDEEERQAVCRELKSMAKAWRTLEQDGEAPFIGSVNKQPLNDIFLIDYPKLVGPYTGSTALQEFQDACGIEISVEVPIVFTHNDLLPPNILVSSGPNPKIVCILDWGQSGWYPAYWEYCKARRVGMPPVYLTNDEQEEWRAKYLPTFVDALDNETYYYPWLYFALSKGM